MTFIPVVFVYIGYLYFLHCGLKVQGLEAYGCEDNWLHFQEYCYKIVLTETTADGARNQCRSLGSELASVWSEQEESFIISSWQFPRLLLGFVWTGLRGGAPGDNWQYDDLSSLADDSPHGWSLLKDVSGIPVSTDNTCVALRPGPSSTVAFLNCNMDASAYACKKALQKLYITPGVWNRTQLPATSPPLNHAQTFERMYPPRLTFFPDTDTKLARVEVDGDVDCAYKCFSINSCMLFQVSCHSESRCARSKCVLFPHTPGFL